MYYNFNDQIDSITVTSCICGITIFNVFPETGPHALLSCRSVDGRCVKAGTPGRRKGENKMRKKFLAGLLALVMLLSLGVTSLGI